MGLQLITENNISALEGEPGVKLLQKPEDAADLIGAGFENGTRSLLLYAENLTEQFFDLSSGEAGVILQKLRNYHIKTAIVAPTDRVKRSTMFGEMEKEESKSGDFRIFEDRDSAVAWLMKE